MMSVTELSFERYFERVFEPVGMNSSGYDRNRYVIEKRASGYTRGPFGMENAQYIETEKIVNVFESPAAAVLSKETNLASKRGCNHSRSSVQRPVGKRPQGS